MDYTGLMFPKTPKKKKRQVHRKSIMHQKDGTCYFCLKRGDYSKKYTENHHAVFGKGNRPLSEEYGLTVNLCLYHHKESWESVHKNQSVREALAADAQRAFVKHFPELDFYEIFQINYL